jgi:multidrug resistance efflux pump
LRINGTLAPIDFGGIRVPKMWGGRDGRNSNALTLTELAKPGSTVQAGAVVAEFEFQFIQDHLTDIQSRVVQSEADLQRLRAEIMIDKKARLQALLEAKAARDKARLDLRTGPVRSEIEAEMLQLAAEESEVTYRQQQKELELQEIARASELRARQLEIEMDRLHATRHERDIEQMRLTTPVGGRVILEPIYRGGGEFHQVESGDQVNPGTLFMRVVDLSEMVVEGSLNQVDSQAVRIGQRAEIRIDAYPDLVLPGRVTSVGAMATPGSSQGSRGRAGREEFVRSVGIEVSMENSDSRVVPDLSASASILLERQEGSLLIPRAAVWREDDESFVRLRRGEDFVTRQIEIGAMNAVEVVVAEGLREGDTVALIRARTTADYSQRHERDQSGNSRNRAAASAGGGS